MPDDSAFVCWFSRELLLHTARTSSVYCVHSHVCLPVVLTLCSFPPFFCGSHVQHDKEMGTWVPVIGDMFSTFPHTGRLNLSAQGPESDKLIGSLAAMACKRVCRFALPLADASDWLFLPSLLALQCGSLAKDILCSLARWWCAQHMCTCCPLLSTRPAPHYCFLPLRPVTVCFRVAQ